MVQVPKWLPIYIHRYLLSFSGLYKIPYYCSAHQVPTTMLTGTESAEEDEDDEDDGGVEEGTILSPVCSG